MLIIILVLSVCLTNASWTCPRCSGQCSVVCHFIRGRTETRSQRLFQTKKTYLCKFFLCYIMRNLTHWISLFNNLPSAGANVNAWVITLELLLLFFFDWCCLFSLFESTARSRRGIYQRQSRGNVVLASVFLSENQSHTKPR